MRSSGQAVHAAGASVQRATGTSEHSLSPAGLPPGGEPPPRIVIESVRPEVDGGRFPARACQGDNVAVEADIYAEGHDLLAADLLYRRVGSARWRRAPMRERGNDRWLARFLVAEVAHYTFTIEAWVARFATWREFLARKVDAGQDVAEDLLIGAQLVKLAAAGASRHDAAVLGKAAAHMAGRASVVSRIALALSPELSQSMRHCERRSATRYGGEPLIRVDPPKAGFSAWYEMFPRSAAPVPGKHGTFRDVERLLPYVAAMGFDVLYLPPIHPIAKSKRKGRNNSAGAAPGDPGSPWAIGGAEGGHKAVHPELGTLADFRRLVRAAARRGIDIALDIALQCSPEHPYVREHPEWFKVRPDGSVQYAENPPKKYEDIYPLNFETGDWRALWEEVRSIFLYWMEQGVRIFRVDNPHTKPFRFWEWLIAEIREADPSVILLAEAFTRPRIMQRLAKVGFHQSYTYFAWRNTKRELTEYFTELSMPPLADYFRPNAWPSTPDILTEQLQTGGRPAFISRLVLAATLSANYGIYGPPFELMEHTPREAGSEEYLDSEKYELRHWDRRRPDSLRDVIALVNRARRENDALQASRGLAFHATDNDELIAYSKRNDGGSNTVVCVVNLDHRYTQSGWVSLPVEDWGMAPDEPYQVHDLLTDARYTWQGPRNFVRLDPRVMPAHVFRLRRRTGGAGWRFE